jgi:hypothetical protein
MNFSYSARLFFCIFFLTTIFKSQNISAYQQSNEIFNITSFSAAENPLELLFVKEQSVKSIRISFNGNEGMEGTIRLYNSQNVQVLEYPIELIKSPNYATIIVSELPGGNYKAELKTRRSTYTSQIEVK